MRTERFDCKKCDGGGLSKFGSDCIYCDGEGQYWREVWETEDRQKHMRKIQELPAREVAARRPVRGGGRKNPPKIDRVKAVRAHADLLFLASDCMLNGRPHVAKVLMDRASKFAKTYC